MLIFPDRFGALNTGGLLSTSGSIRMEGLLLFFLKTVILFGNSGKTESRL